MDGYHPSDDDKPNTKGENMKYFVGEQHMYGGGGVITHFECEPVDNKTFDTVAEARKHLNELRNNDPLKRLRVCIDD